MISGLEKEANRVRELLQRSERDRPFFVEFSGTPKAGKTTIINSLRLFLNRNGYRVTVAAERASTSPVVNKLHVHFNVWTASQTLCQMLETAQWPERSDIVILDRGLFDALAWMDWMRERDKVDASDMRKIVDFLMIDSWQQMIDVVFIMRTTPEVSLLREYKDQVTKKPGRIMNEQAVNAFNQSLDRTKERYGEFFLRMFDVSTSDDTQPDQTAAEVVKITLNTIRNMIDG